MRPPVPVLAPAGRRCLICGEAFVKAERALWSEVQGRRGLRHAKCKPARDGQELFPFQQEGVEFLRAHRGVLLADDMGLGKLQPVDSLVLTPSGWRKIGLLKIGDSVIGSNGRATKVSGVFPQGVKTSYRVRFSDGSSVEAGDEHLWTILYRRGGKHWAEMTLTTQQLREQPCVGKLNLSGVKLYLPLLTAPAIFETSIDLKFEAYTMGALLSNGGLGHRTPMVTCHALDIEHVAARIGETETLGARGLYGKATRFAICDAIERIYELGLEILSEEKFIPLEYLLASPRDRMNLLQGLLDGDGSISKKGNKIVYHTTSFRLTQGIQFLVEGLGGIASLRTYDRRAEGKPIEYQVRIRVPTWVKPFSVPRKAEMYKPGSHALPTRTVQSVEYSREVDSVCIAVDADDQLYVTEHCILTHNTLQVIGLINQAPEIESALIVCPKSLASNWAAELARWLTRDLKIAARADIPGGDITIATFTTLEQLDETRLWDLLVVDEAQYIKGDSQRAERVLELGKRCHRRVAATGTPIENRPLDAWNILRLVAPRDWDPPGVIRGEPVEAGMGAGLWRYARSYCDLKKRERWETKDGKKRKKVWWDMTGSSNLEELGRKMRETCMLRRTKAEVLPELPAKMQRLVFLEPPEGVENILERERRAFESVYPTYEAAIESLEGPKLKLEELSRARAEVGKLKIEPAAEWLEELLSSGKKVIVFAHHKNVIKSLAKHLENFSPVVLTGESTEEERADAVQRFQKDPNVKLFLGSIRAAGVGLTLTASSNVVTVEQDWNPAVMMQATDRAHRIGQKNAVLVQHLVFDGSVDARVMRCVLKKQKMIEKTGLGSGAIE